MHLIVPSRIRGKLYGVLTPGGSDRIVDPGSERMGNIIIPYGSKILRSLLRRASIYMNSSLIGLNFLTD